MKNYLVILFALAIFVSCERPEEDGLIRNAVHDIDGNSYDAVRVGNQVWMASNLKTSHYADGTEIPLFNGNTEDIYRMNPLRFYPDENSSNVNDYGYLYTWTAVLNGESPSSLNPSGVQGICPQGWHLPSNAEWEELIATVTQKVQYGESVAQALASNNGSWMQSSEMGTPGQNANLNNSTKFSAVPAGCYDLFCPFYQSLHNGYCNFGYGAYFWSASYYQGEWGSFDLGSYWCMYNNKPQVYCGLDTNGNGFSVRCLRD